MKIIDGRILAEKIKDHIAQEIYQLKGLRPNLAIVLVGERPDSRLYVSLKEREAKKIGIDTHLYKCPENISEAELLEMIKCLNQDDLIDAILVQLPLPGGLDADTIIMALDSAKDIDGFHPDNLEKLLSDCEFNGFMPPVFATVLEMLKSIDCDIKNKQVCIISNSDIFGKSLAHVLKCLGAQVETVGADDEKLSGKTGRADILITAVGQPKMIRKDMIKAGAVIIDVGINETDGKVMGDADFEDIKDKAGAITPVPGGVGPMTIAMAFKNTLVAYRNKNSINKKKYSR